MTLISTINQTIAEQTPLSEECSNLDTLKGWLRQRLSHERYEHSIGAYEKALELADTFGVTEAERQKAALAALLHDSAKLMSPTELLAYCRDFDIELDELDRAAPQTLHPYVGAELVKRTFEISDEEILNAIRFHTTGRANMSRVEVLVYIADKIEGNTRNPLYTQKICANLDPKDPDSLDKTLLFILDSTLNFLIEKNQIIHPRTLEARNSLVLALKSRQNNVSP